MDKLELLIDQARLQTDNSEFNETSGIQDAEFIQSANSAQERLQSLIIKEHSSAFEEEQTISVVSGQSDYDMPALAFLGYRVEKVEYSSTGSARNYRTLKKKTLIERSIGTTGTPGAYIKRNKTLIIDPTPQSSGTLRVTFIKVLPRLDIRRGTVSEVLLNSTTSSITTLVLDPSVTLDTDTLTNKAYLTVVNKDGEIQMAGIPVASVNSTSGAVTLDGSFTYASGETIAVGDYVVAGKYSSTHSPLPDHCEKYLIEYMAWRALKRNSSGDSVEQTQELQGMEMEIVSSFAEDGMDVDFIPIISGDFLSQEDWSG